ETHLADNELVHLPLRSVTAARIESYLQGKAADLAPASLNQLRGMIRTAWNAGRRAGFCAGANPVADVKLRRVPKRKPTFLEAHEVAPVLEQIAERWRPFFATAIYTGLRKGELIGLRKSDIDLHRLLLTVRSSYDRTTKGAHEEAIPIAAELVPYLERALDQSRSELVFPGPDGKMLSEHTPVGDMLRRALWGVLESSRDGATSAAGASARNTTPTMRSASAPPACARSGPGFPSAAAS
ncbi:MAG: hypothetical protein E6J58_07125, partial [Deltaproteobacteria bacterium]